MLGRMYTLGWISTFPKEQLHTIPRDIDPHSRALALKRWRFKLYRIENDIVPALAQVRTGLFPTDRKILTESCKTQIPQ